MGAVYPGTASQGGQASSLYSRSSSWHLRNTRGKQERGVVAGPSMGSCVSLRARMGEQSPSRGDETQEEHLGLWLSHGSCINPSLQGRQLLFCRGNRGPSEGVEGTIALQFTAG